MGKANTIDGKAVSRRVLDEVKSDVRRFALERGRRPGLATVLVGDNPASGVYVRMKIRACEECGIESCSHDLPPETTTGELLNLVDALNADDNVDGILVQLPLPDGVDAVAVLDRIDPAKDVDGFHPVNVGRLVRGDTDVLMPCTPAGVMLLLDSEGIDPRGKHAVVIGRSDIVGKPLALLLLHRHATVTICHSRTTDLEKVARDADILVAAVGRALMVKGNWVKEGSVVIDVGQNMIRKEDAPRDLLENPGREADFERKGYTLVGDVSFEVEEVAGFLTPVPGGVGPMTIAMLMANTVKAAQWRLTRSDGKE